MVRLIAVLLALGHGTAAAQSWELKRFDDGSFFAGTLTSGRGLMISCGERSRQGVSATVTGNLEPLITHPRSYLVDFDPALVGDPAADIHGRNDIMFVAGTTGYVLQNVFRDELFGTWRVHLERDDLAFRGLRGQPALDIRWQGGSARLPSEGFDAGISALEAYCSENFAAIGKSWAIAPDLTAKGSPMRVAAEAAIERGCNGPATRGENYLLLANLDGDGAEDVVLDWGRIECQGGDGTLASKRPFCGASNCSQDIFISAVFARSGQPETVLALGSGLVALSNGNQGVSLHGGLSTCNQAQGTDSCEIVWYWNGTDFVRLN